MLTENPTPSKQPGRTRQRVLTVLRVLITFGLLALVLREVGLGDTLQTLRHAHPGWVVVVLALMLVEGLHGTYKWLILLRHTRHDVRFWPLFRLNYISGFLGMFVPGGVGIELVRMYGLAKQTADLAMSFTSVLMDRILGLTGLTLVILIGVVLQGRQTVPGIEYWSAGALALILTGWVAIMNSRFRALTDWVLRSMLGRVTRNSDDTSETGVKHTLTKWSRIGLEMVRDKQNKVYASLDTYRSRPGLLAWALLQSLLYNGIRIAVCYSTGLAVGVDVSPVAYVIAVPVVIFVMLVPISMAGWGVREIAFVQLLTAFGADGEKVAAMSILVGILGTVSILPGAWFCLRSGRPTAPPQPSRAP